MSPYFLNHFRASEANFKTRTDCFSVLLSITAIFAYFFLCTAVHNKKNWLFIGHPDAGQRSAIIYSLVVSCQRHGKDPLAYLRHALTYLPAMTTKDDLAPLLPANWQAPTATPLL